MIERTLITKREQVIKLLSSGEYICTTSNDYPTIQPSIFQKDYQENRVYNVHRTVWNAMVRAKLVEIEDPNTANNRTSWRLSTNKASTRMCEQCHSNEPIWAMQYIASDTPSFYALGHHMRGFSLIRVCDACREKQAPKTT